MSAVVFDAYGTLFNLDSLLPLVTAFVGDEHKAKRITRVWRTKQLDYAWTSVLMNRFQDFDKLTDLALKFALQDNGVYDEKIVRRLVQAYVSLPLYDDVRGVLDELATNHKLAILSNGTFRSLQTLTNSAGVMFSFDYILSTEPIRTYKPAREAYDLALQKLGNEKSDIVFVSSNHWDVTGAKAFGFRTYWCNRTGQTPDPLSPAPDGIITSLADLPSLL
ncbi:haloacid dehalogenase type II [Alicyclobacillus dauci]|uniref:Haloacid dehalogenase type II n=1 Tax=Alicyclobacillus dauci TaxID=1475485 RepID=A0ABY6Z8X2_9BACL|nr:haloacid dehalogenase type II [Alicyclobacillus dauci]WAH38706.1 haloacid dehalogenase type II [Alicyclobacillus dauci]